MYKNMQVFMYKRIKVKKCAGMQIYMYASKPRNIEMRALSFLKLSREMDILFCPLEVELSKLSYLLMGATKHKKGHFLLSNF